MDNERVTEGSDVLEPPSSECAPPVLWFELVVLDDEIESSRPFLGAVGVRSVLVLVRSTDMIAAGVVGPLGNMHVASSQATD